jgi:hypothetical protein
LQSVHNFRAMSKVNYWLLLFFAIQSCVSHKTTLLKPNLEKVNDSLAIIVLNNYQLSLTDNEDVFLRNVLPTMADAIPIYFETSLDWELKKNGIHLRDTSTFHRLLNNNYGYLLIFSISKVVDPPDYDYLTTMEVQQLLCDPSIVNEYDYSKQVTVLATLVSLRTRNIIYKNQVVTHHKSMSLDNNDGSRYVINWGVIKSLYGKSVKKSVKKLVDDCDL